MKTKCKLVKDNSRVIDKIGLQYGRKINMLKYGMLALRKY
jgi:hypothetical protein